MLSDLFVSACSRLRDNGEKAKEESKREARTGKKKREETGERTGRRSPHCSPQEPPALFPVPARFTFAFALLFVLFPTILEPGTGYICVEDAC